MRRERHIYTLPLTPTSSRPYLRDFGPQSEDDLLDQPSLTTLEKLLPVLNGLLYNSQGTYLFCPPNLLDNRRSVQSNYDMLMTIFDVFAYQLPIDLHENALYALLNLISDCK